MYEIDGVEVTYEDLLGRAEELGITFDELLKKNPSIKLLAFTEKDENVTKENNNTSNVELSDSFDPLVFNKQFERGYFKGSERKDYNEYKKP